MVKKHMWQILVLSILSVAVSTYLLYVHYTPSTDICLPNSHGNNGCDIVNKSKYAEFFGIPLGLAGMGMFSLVAALAAMYILDTKIHPKGVNKKKIVENVYKLILFNLLFVVYLVYVEVYLLHAICTFCTVLHVFIIYMFITILLAKKKITPKT